MKHQGGPYAVSMRDRLQSRWPDTKNALSTWAYAVSCNCSIASKGIWRNVWQGDKFYGAASHAHPANGARL